jgi:hypothetical protein
VCRIDEEKSSRPDVAAPERHLRKPARPLAELVDSCLGEALAKRSQPVRIAWPRKPTGLGRNPAPPEPATLHIRVESAFALELQHQAPLIVERVNSYFGWACVGRLRLEQGPVGRGKTGPVRAPAPSAAAVEAARAAAAGVADEGLREALVRLGAAVIARERGAKS